MCVERALGLKEEHPASKALCMLRWVITFHVVCLSWVFFRSSGVGHAGQTIRRIVTWAPGENYIGYSPIAAVALMLALDYSDARAKFVKFFSARPALLRWSAYATVLLLVLTFQKVVNPEFIYFAF